MEKSGKYNNIVGKVINGVEEGSWLMRFKVDIVQFGDCSGMISFVPGRVHYYFREEEVPKEIFDNVYRAMKARFEIYYNMESTS